MVLNIGVFGAGIVGLTTALEAQKKFPDAKITITAELFNQDTTSDGAAGLWLPGTSFFIASDEITKEVLANSFTYYENLIAEYPATETGVKVLPGYILSNISENMAKNDLVEDILPVYRPATPAELKAFNGKCKYGYYCETILAECRILLPWLIQRFQKNGGIVVQKKVTSLTDMSDFDIVFNCLGLGAKEIFNDRLLVPIRGQIIKVVAPQVKNFYMFDNDAYIIPASSNITLGGCRNYDSHDLSPSSYDTAAILKRCYSLLPELEKARIERTWVGLRPHRDTVRIEVVDQNVQGKKIKVVHNYGHGGYGVTAAPGSAQRAVGLLSESFKH